MRLRILLTKVDKKYIYANIYIEKNIKKSYFFIVDVACHVVGT